MQFWIPNSDPIPKMSVLDIENIHSFYFDHKNVRIIVSGSGGATNFGPSRTTYLVFDNGTEMPWRYAIYELGNFGSIDTVSKKSDSEILMKVVLYSKWEDSDCEYCELDVTLDLSEVFQKEKMLDLDHEMIEGSITSQLNLVVEKR